MAPKKKINKLARSLITNLCILIILLAVFEIALSAYFHFNFKDFSRQKAYWQRRQTLNRILGSNYPIGKSWQSKLLIHPFFGYVFDPRGRGINNYGFRIDYDFELCGTAYCLNPSVEKSLIVGIFGGSFAYFTAKEDVVFANKLKELYPERSPVILNFAIGGYALPQTLFVFEQFKELLDIAIFIDGVNEIWNFIENNQMGGPPEYAKVAHFKYRLSGTELSPNNMKLSIEILMLHKIFVAYTKFSLLPVIEKSFATHCLWQQLQDLIQYLIDKKTVLINESYFSSRKFHLTTEENLINFALKKWEQYHLQISDIARKNHITDFHFIQPHIYVPESKQLTHEEKEIHDAENMVKKYLSMGYPLLREKMQVLRDHGVRAYDLSYVFKDYSERVWNDPYHPNKKGLELIIDGVYDKISEALQAEQANGI